MRTIKPYFKGAPFYNAFLRTWLGSFFENTRNRLISDVLPKLGESRDCKRLKGRYFGKSVGGGRDAFGGSLSENFGYAVFRNNCPEIMPRHSISSIRVNPRNPKATGLKKIWGEYEK